MEKVDTETLRSAASKWSLNGDRHLLDLLQNIHQKIMTKCTETNARMEELVDSLDTANVDLQNVNNKFMALSNNQFVESRVYDDDIDTIQTETAAVKEPERQANQDDELDLIKQSLLIIEAMHEQVQILDSDSSDDDDDGRLILKPKEMYHHRPLPYIIGSQMWRKKWHAGLVVEDSDTDSAGSKPQPGEEYSDSEPEVTDIQRDKQHKDVTISSSNTSVEVITNTQTKPDVPRPCRPADVAAELARRLGGDIPPPPSIPVDLPPTTGKVYRPEQPTRATIFSNEPPPLDQCESEDSEEDIFAELHKNSYTHNDRVSNTNVVNELFGSSPVVVEKVVSNTNDKRPIFDDESEPELFTEKPKEKAPEPKEERFKKPIGGISLFGSNKDSNSIGAAILKRNQRKSSSDEEIPETQPEPIPVQNKNIIDDLFVKPKVKKPIINKHKEVKKEIKVKKEEKVTEKKDLFSDDLFDDIDDIFTSKVITKKPENKSIFDDVSKGNKEVKSIFDDDDDDLFSDVKVIDNVKPDIKKDTVKKNADTKTNKDIIKDDLFTDTENIKTIESNSINKSNKPKSIFDDDSDDDLFKTTTEIVNTTKIKTNNTVKENNIKADVKKNSIFDDDSDDELFLTNSLSVKSNADVTNQNSNLFKDEKVQEIKSKTDSSKNEANIKDNYIPNEITKRRIFDDDSEEELFSGNKPETNKDLQENDVNIKVNVNSKKEDLSKEQEDIKAPVEIITNSTQDANIPEILEIDNNESINKTVEKTETQNTPLDKNDKLNIKKNLTQITSPNIFDDDEIDDLFSNTAKQSNNNEEYKVDVASSINIVESDATQDITTVGNKEISSNVQEDQIFDNPQPPLPDISSHIENNIDKETLKSNEDLKEAVKDEPNSKSDLKETKDMEDKTDTFSDILTTDDIFATDKKEKPESTLFTDIFNDMPPEFEKPKEPKKSKNVNALFDDDSDDETFFKKSDVISEDIPSPSYDANERFSIFHDEPPAIDVDFIPKPVKLTKNTDENITNAESTKNIDFAEINNDFDDFNSQDIFQQKVKTDEKADFIPVNTEADKIETKLENNLKAINESNKVANESSLEDSIRSTNAMITDKINKMQNDQKLENADVKPNKNVGKLKPINLNINVNTLLPGASPKKSKSIQIVDDTVTSKPENTEATKVKTVNFEDVKEPEILNKSKEEPKIEVVDGLVSSKPINTEKLTKEVKIVNFEDEKESEILNNKISKERAKIQVKRRPSTRRARIEAARKSGIDFGNTIDSTDNPSSIDEPKTRLTDEKDSNLDTDMKVSPDKETKTQTDVTNNKNTTDTLQSNTDDNYSKPKVTSKVVYILNDEDIFSDVNKNPDEKPQNHENKTNNTLSIQSTEKSPIDKKLDDNHNPNTDKKASIFDSSDSDSELFGGKKVTVKKNKLFESDSDDDLFSGRSKKEKLKEEIKPKGNLFGDDDDDELFTTKVRKQEDKVPRRESTSKTSEPVFEDPLSMLTQDDE